jgi:hypothetical protein
MPGADGVFGTTDDYVYPLGIDPAQNLGYFMYTENSPADEQGEDADDWVAFTMRMREPSKAFLAGQGSIYTGRAIRAPGPDGQLNTADDVISEADAGLMPAGDNLAGSYEAEVIYYLRRGTLYRRQLLVGVPQPAYNPLLASRSWYELNDISARPPIEATYAPVVNTMGDLSFRSARFMHRLPASYTTGLAGFPTLEQGLATDSPGDANFPFLPPLQYVESGNNSGFHDAESLGALTSADQLDHNRNYPVPMKLPEFWFGFPTMRETSSPAWNFPNNPASTIWTDYADPMNTTGPRYHTNLYTTATRVAEDAIATNVVSFDVKAWDPDAIPNPNGTGAPTGAYVDLGKLWPGASPSVVAPGPRPSNGTPAGLPGYLPNPPFGPLPGSWPPSRLPWPGPDRLFGTPDDVLMVGWDGKPGVAVVDDDGDGVVDDISEMFWLGSDDVRPDGRGFGEPFGYDSTISPAYAIPPGYGLDLQPGVAGTDDDGNGATDDAAEYGWSGSDDILGNPPLGMLRAPFRLARSYDTWCTAYTKPTQFRVQPVAPPYIAPLRGIQIKIRFVDPATRLTREITIIQELLP